MQLGNKEFVMISVVQEYIFLQTGKHVKIVFNDPSKFVLHLEMLTYAYNHVMAQEKKN